MNEIIRWWEDERQEKGSAWYWYMRFWWSSLMNFQFQLDIFYIKEIKIPILNILTSHSRVFVCWFNIYKITFRTSKRLRQKLCFLPRAKERASEWCYSSMWKKQKKLLKELYDDEEKAGRNAIKEIFISNSNIYFSISSFTQVIMCVHTQIKN